MSTDIEIEDIHTWPDCLVDMAVRHKELILRYQVERQRIDNACQDDFSLRFDPPENEWKADYSALAESIEPLLTTNRIIGYHCTRLSADEIREIRSDGLQLLSEELVRARLDSCLLQGHLSERDHAYLIASDCIQDCLSNVQGKRAGIIWLCPNRSTLTQSSGVYRLFRFWGGEAIYWGHEDDARISQTLRRIGTPCIVKCAIPFRNAQQHHTNFSERFLSQIISDEIECPEPSSQFDMHTKTSIPASGILEVIDFASLQFEALTQCSSWATDHAIVDS